MGWYVEAVDENPRSLTALRAPHKVTPEGALLIARAFDQALSAANGRPTDSFEAGVRRQNEFARDRVREAAAEANRRAELAATQHAKETRRRAADLAVWDNATALSADDLECLQETAAWMGGGGVDAFQESRAQFAAGNSVSTDALRQEFATRS